MELQWLGSSISLHFAGFPEPVIMGPTIRDLQIQSLRHRGKKVELQEIKLSLLIAVGTLTCKLYHC